MARPLEPAGPSPPTLGACAAPAASAIPVADSLRSIVRPAAEAIGPLRVDWTELANEAAEPNCYAEHWFVAAALNADEDAAAVRLFELRRGDRLIGVIPLVVGRHYGRTPVRHVTNWRYGQSFLGTPMIGAGEEELFWSALLQALDDAGWAPNFLHLTGFVENGPVHRGLIAAAAARGRDCAVVHRETRALLESTLGSAAYYERNVRPKKRKELRRLRHRLDELGRVETRCLATGDELPIWCDAFLALEKAGWKGSAGSALACAPASEAFFRDAVAGAWAAGRLSFLRLDLDGRPIAMLVNFVAPPGSFSFKTCFDERHARFSPGVLIQLENLRLLDRHEVGWMDSCAAENHPMIESLWTGRRRIVRVTVRLEGWRRRLVFLLCRALENGSRALRSFAGRGMS